MVRGGSPILHTTRTAVSALSGRSTPPAGRRGAWQRSARRALRFFPRWTLRAVHPRQPDFPRPRFASRRDDADGTRRECHSSRNGASKAVPDGRRTDRRSRSSAREPRMPLLACTMPGHARSPSWRQAWTSMAHRHGRPTASRSRLCADREHRSRSRRRSLPRRPLQVGGARQQPHHLQAAETVEAADVVQRRWIVGGVAVEAQRRSIAGEAVVEVE